MGKFSNVHRHRYCLFSGYTVGSGEVTENDMAEVIELLTPDELTLLYVKLGISHVKVQKAEDSAGGRGPDIKALNVLRQWKQMNGQLASKEKMLEAMKQCKFVDSYEKLTKIWRK